MSFLDAIPIIGKLFSDTTDIIKEVVIDKDKQLEIIGNLQKAKDAIDKEVYLKELETKTITWVDAIHKMSRTMLSFACIIVVGVLMILGHEITPTVALILGGPTAAYTIVKGKGK